MALDEQALQQLRKRVLAGGAERYHAANAAKGKLFARERIALLVDEDSFVEDGLFANALADGLPADGVVTGAATIDGRPVCLMANDSTVKAGSWGARTVEKIIRIIERAYADRRADGVPGRLGRRPHHRPGRPVPRSARRRAHLLEPGPRLGLDPAGVRAVRAVRRRRRLHPGVLRRRRDGRGQRLDVPRLRPHGRDGHRREDHPRGDGRRAGSTVPSRASATSCARPRPRRSTWCGATCPTCRPTGRASRRPPQAVDAPADVDLAALVPASERQAFDMRRFVKGLLDAGLVLRDPGAVGPRGDGRVRPARRRGRRGGGEQLAAQGRRAVRRLGRQGDPVRAALRRVQRAAAVPLRRARLHGRQPRWRSRASSGTARR